MAEQLVIDADAAHVATINAVLKRFGGGAIAYAARAGVRITALAQGEKFSERSPALKRLGAGVDRWPIPPAGLFVVEERTVYLRSISPMTIAHEFSHGLDCALGGGVYRSGVDPRIRRAFDAATAFVTPYAASGCDEWLAENLRAYVGVNDPQSLWPRATRERLLSVDPRGAALVAEFFEKDFAASAVADVA